ncbi:MAG TPA: thioesterase family protein [Puia sp.]|nr:thioesterase family protein [Puia sp.]
MARIKIDLPERFPFSTSFPVRITDLNYGSHVGNDTVLSFLHEARVRFLQSLGYNELNLEGAGLIMSDAALEFKNEIRYGDELVASVAAGDFSRVGFDFYYKLEKKGDEPQLLALAKTGMVCFDYERKKVVALPEAAKKKLGG